MTKEELTEIRLKKNYSLTDMAGFIGIAKSTYQRYEDGSAAVPADMPQRIAEAERREFEWMQRLPGMLDECIKARFPFGIIGA